MGSDSQASVAKRASGTFPGFAMPALPTASADSSMSAVELFCRNGSSSARSSLDSQEQQSGRTPSLPAPDMLCSSAAALPPIGPTPSGTVQAAAAAASAAAAAFRAMYGGAALGGRRPSIALVPLEAVQLTIQPLDMTSRAAAAGAGAACAAAADALRALSGASQSGSSVLQMLQRASNTAASEATEQQGPAEGSGAGCALRTTSAGGGHSSDDTQSRSLVFSRHPAPTAPSADTDGPQSRAALATANRRSALLRFRRKREARTFDKKVRYVSRKRLAEARPRVRGQFVKAEVAAAFFAAQKAETEPAGAEPMDVSAAVLAAC